jgi:hypothetical protein
VFVLDRRRATLFAVQISLTTKSPDHFENSLKYFEGREGTSRLKKWQDYWKSVRMIPMKEASHPSCHRNSRCSWKKLVPGNLDFLPKEPQPKLVLVLVYFAPKVETEGLIRPALIAPWDYTLSAPFEDQKCFFRFLRLYN